ncbi:hypothetical protein OCA13_20895 [Bacillus cereus]|nr:hypothetical protein [Bacillus cereus]
MQSITVDTKKAIAKINGNNYPMYCGFLNAESLKTIAEVPSYFPTKSHHQIASDIIAPPVDQWQRPLDEKKTNQIKEIYSDSLKDNLMANPILLGVATPNISSQVSITIEQDFLKAKDGSILPVPNNFNININYTEDKKPLWILDGQHRIEGMIKSVQKNEPVPFVLLYDENLYTPPFLAEIFTQVTTRATPMQPLHAEWMKFAFKLDKYAEDTHNKSMKTVIYLCKEASFDGMINPLHNKIQFNPYQPLTGHYAFSFNMDEWCKIIADNYYGSGGTLEPISLAHEIVKIIRSLEETDRYTNNGSKLFSNENQKILAEGFLCGFLSYMSIHNTGKTQAEWKVFLEDPLRRFGRCDWRLSFIRSTGALSSSFQTPSKIIAKECFDVAFNDPASLNGNTITDFLQGVSSNIKVTAHPKTAAGRPSNNNIHEGRFSVPSGLNPFNTTDGGTPRNIIRIDADSPNIHVLKVLDTSVNPALPLNDALTRSGLDISTYPSGKEIEIITMNYTGDTQKSITIRLDK